MANQLTEEVKKTVKEQSQKHKTDKKVEEFEKAAKEFNDLVEAGFISRRGYTLLSIEDAHLKRASFNSI